MQRSAQEERQGESCLGYGHCQDVTGEEYDLHHHFCRGLLKRKDEEQTFPENFVADLGKPEVEKFKKIKGKKAVDVQS